MGALSLAGVFNRTQPGGRYVFGVGWLLIGAGWIARYRLAERNWRREREEHRSGREDEAPVEGGDRL